MSSQLQSGHLVTAEAIAIDWSSNCNKDTNMVTTVKNLAKNLKQHDFLIAIALTNVDQL
jgi:hypothetical protein